MKFVFIFFGMFYISLDLFSQKINLMGFVVDSLSNKGVPGASIIIKANNKDASLMSTSTVADSSGKFHFINLLFGNYSITVSSVGYISSIFFIDVNDSTKDIGMLPLNSKYDPLKNVTIYTQKQLYTIKSDKITFSVSNDSSLKNKMAYDAMLKMPFIISDISGELNYKNGKKYIVLVNGYRYGLITKEPSSILKSIPAIFIKSVELQTVPESKYANLGYEAVINIITVDGYLRGYLGSVSAGIDTRAQSSNNIFFIAQKTKFGIQGFTRFENNNNRRTGSGVITDLLNGSSNQQYSNIENTHNTISIGDLSLQYDKSDNLRFNLYFSMGFINHRKTIQDSVNYLSNVNLSNLSFTGLLKNKNLHKEVGIDLILDNKIKKTLWNLRSKFSHDAIDEPSLNNYVYSNSLIKSTDVINYWANTEYLGELNYTKKFNSGISYEGSIRPIFRQYLSSWKSNPGLNIDTFINLGEANSKHLQSIIQGSNSFRKEWKNSTLQIELLSESVKYQNDNFTKKTAEKISYFNVLPKVVFKFPMTKKHYLELKYHKTVIRPNYFTLGSYYSIGSSQNITAGNSSLSQQLISEISMGTDGELFKNKMFYYLTASHNYSNSLIAPLAKYDNSNRVIITQYTEAGRYENYILSVGLYAGILKNKLTINFNNSLGQYVYRNRINATNSKSLFNSLNLSIIFQASKTSSYNFLCYVNTLSPTFQGKETTKQDYQFSFTKILFNNKSILKFYISDPFLAERKFIKNISTAEFTHNNESYKQARVVGFSISYRFGKLGPSNSSKRLRANDLLEKK